MPQPLPLLLASASPRRAELLSLLNIPFDTISSGVSEVFQNGTLEENLCRIAREKAEGAVKQASDLSQYGGVLAADTIVSIGGEVLGKPANETEAAKMLEALSGKRHQVLTGIALLQHGTNSICLEAAETTHVFFKPLGQTEIDSYVQTGEPMDKAGAYAIQGFASVFIEKIEGDYFNVVGLPLFRLSQLLRRINYPCPVWKSK